MAAGLLAHIPAWAGNWEQSNFEECRVQFSNTQGGTHYPAITLNIPQNISVGDFVSDWISLPFSSTYGFINCDYPVYGTPPSGDNAMMYVRGNKPAAVIADTTVTVKDGYHVFTAAALKAAGLGFIIRWRVGTRLGNVAGDWNSPGSGWPADSPVPSVHGLEFWRLAGVFGYEYQDTPVGGGQSESHVSYRQFHAGLSLSSYAGWLSLRQQAASSYSETVTGSGGVVWTRWHYGASTYVVNYYPHVEVRFLAIGDTPINDFETLPEGIAGGIELVTISPRPDAHYTSPIHFIAGLSIKYAAWGTCTTPSVAVPFALKQSDLPSAPGAVTAPGGTATFNLTLTGYAP